MRSRRKSANDRRGGEEAEIPVRHHGEAEGNRRRHLNKGKGLKKTGETMGESRQRRISFTPVVQEAPQSTESIPQPPPRQREERVAPSSGTFQLPRQCLQQVQAHALAEYPDMACGFIVTGDGNDWVRPCTNIQNKLHAEDPVRFPADARTGFTMAKEDIAKIVGEVHNNGWEVKACYYSQDAPRSTISKLSQTMLKEWSLWFPGVSMFILSLQGRNVVDAAAYKWDEERQDSVQLDVEIEDY
jgi:hypothetical protein